MTYNDIKSLYYPGAGRDFSTIAFFIQNSSIERFYYCDYLNDQIRPQHILKELRQQFPSYKINEIAELKPSYFNKEEWGDYWCSESDGQTFTGRKENSFIALYRIELLDKTWELYYFGTEAIETFKILIENQVNIDLVVTQDHGLGCLWTTFCKGSYLEAIASVNDKMPNYLFVGEKQDAWSGYKQVSGPMGVLGVLERPRIMFELSDKMVGNIGLKSIYNSIYKRSFNL